MEGHAINKKGISASTITMIFVAVLFIESLLVYYHAAWRPTVYLRYAKSMIRTDYSNLLFIMGYSGLIFMTIITANKIKIRLSQLFIVYILIICSMVWTMLSIGKFSIANILGSQTPATVFFLMVFYILAYDNGFWSKFNKALYCGGVFYSLLSFIDALGFVIRYGFTNKLTSSPALTYLSYAIFMLAIYIAMNFKFRFRDIVILYVSECLLLTVGIIALSRGWIIQVGILLLFSIQKLGSSSGNKIRNIILVCMIAVLAWFAISNSVSTAISSLFDRGTEDTRTNQLDDFFNQVSWRELVKGGGMGATYDFGSRLNYQFIDNQILFIDFRYGVLACVFYLMFFLRPFFKHFSIKSQKYMLCVPIFMWLLAMMGVSTYFNVSNNVLHLCMIIYVGRLSYYMDSKLDYRSSTDTETNKVIMKVNRNVLVPSVKIGRDSRIRSAQELNGS
ncbi:hypothetical protein H8B09_22280 [Paenibacillus sp. PR3]|uniref:Uncharacterized protein n=1 Tax=Paenibacillus terricola TaxID=2763503 RepID=A0ABR8MZZ3_9BACL|nr:hypothetical protein [Paenibacillus terricola]MBD3921512.1 hypothetical protein [Paenibacillus terricola]